MFTLALGLFFWYLTENFLLGEFFYAATALALNCSAHSRSEKKVQYPKNLKKPPGPDRWFLSL
jgi:hypothetical protein